MSTEQLMKMAKGADEMGGVDMGEEAMTSQERAALKAENTMTRMEKALGQLAETYEFSSDPEISSFFTDKYLP